MSDEKSSVELEGFANPLAFSLPDYDQENGKATAESTTAPPTPPKTKSSFTTKILILLTVVNFLFMLCIGFTQIYVLTTVTTNLATKAEVSETLASVGLDGSAAFIGPPGPPGPTGMDGAPGPQGN